MSDNRRVAGQLLTTAGKTILKDRPGVHGSAENSFEMIGDLWTVYLRHARRVRGVDTIRPEDVAEMMSMLKKGRKIYGDPMNDDNDVDDIGYTALGGMLRLPDPDKSVDETLADNLRVDEEAKAEQYDPNKPLEPDWDKALPENATSIDEARFLAGNKPPEVIRHTHTGINTGATERTPGEILKSLYGLHPQTEE